ncbi:MAG: hypothetical protein Q9217_006446 [Psora testacea]
MDIYSLENAIRSFFNDCGSLTREECDDRARSLLGGGPIVTSTIQGQFSYTVSSPHAATEVRSGDDNSSRPTSNAMIVQFRLSKSKIDLYVAQLAKAIHGDIAAETEYHGEIGQEAGPRLAVYTIQKLPGVTYIEMGNFSVEMDLEQASKQLKMVGDLARFFAASWLHPQLVTQNQREATKTTVSHKLSLLASTLPPRFDAIISRVQLGLDELFHPRYPQVLTHGDLCPMNILVSPTTGCITGIIDWAEAEVLPFGLALYGLENLLGYMGPGRWNYFDIRDELEQKFWNHFWDCLADAKRPVGDGRRNTIMIARQVGVLIQYGFEWENGVLKGAVTEENAGSLAYLDAFLLPGKRHYTDEKIEYRAYCAQDSVF